MAYTYRYDGDNGPDNVYGAQAGSYLMYGYGGNDTLRSYGYVNDSTPYNDYLDGGSGNDVLYSYSGKDQLNGGSGNDYLYGGGGADRLYGQEDNDQLAGENGSDKLYGGSGDDRLYGQSGTDILYGDSGADFLYGGSGRDRLQGDSGSDYLKGGSGHDKFVFTTYDGNDRIDDFTQDQDLICIDKDTGYNSFNDLFISDNGDGDAVIDLGNDGSITVTDMHNYEFTADDFKFF